MSTRFYRQNRLAQRTFLPVSLFQHPEVTLAYRIAVPTPEPRQFVILLPMEIDGHSMKRGRSEPTWNRRILQAWVRMVIKAVIIIGQAIEHRVLAHLKMPKPRGVMARQILEMAAWMETDQLDRLVGQMGELLQERALYTMLLLRSRNGPRCLLKLQGGA